MEDKNIKQDLDEEISDEIQNLLTKYPNAIIGKTDSKGRVIIPKDEFDDWEY